MPYYILSILVLMPSVLIPKYFTTGESVIHIPFDEVNDSITLTEMEGHYLNSLFCIDECTYTLANKDVLFLSGSKGTTFKTKKDFFCNPTFAWLFIIQGISDYNIGKISAVVVFCSKRVPSSKEILKRAMRYNNNHEEHLKTVKKSNK